MRENLIVKIVFVIVWFSWVMFIGWRSLKANNIFTKNPFARLAASTQRYRDTTVIPVKFLHFLIVAILLALFGTGQMLWNKSSNGYICFFFALFFMIAGLIKSAITGSDDTFIVHPPLSYTMKVWFTTIFITPLVLAIPFLTQRGHISDIDTIFPLYLTLVTGGNGFGMAALVVFALSVNHISQTTRSLTKKRMLSFAIAQTTVVSTIAVLSMKTGMNVNWFWIWLAYATVMGISVLYYTFEDMVFFDD